MILVARAEGDHSQFEAKVIAELGELAQKNRELEKELGYLKKELSILESERTYETFDCYRTENWYDPGIITFSGCSGMCFVSMHTEQEKV